MGGGSGFLQLSACNEMVEERRQEWCLFGAAEFKYGNIGYDVTSLLSGLQKNHNKPTTVIINNDTRNSERTSYHDFEKKIIERNLRLSYLDSEPK